MLEDDGGAVGTSYAAIALRQVVAQFGGGNRTDLAETSKSVMKVRLTGTWQLATIDRSASAVLPLPPIPCRPMMPTVGCASLAHRLARSESRGR
jgi:hypothetical protein